MDFYNQIHLKINPSPNSPFFTSESPSTCTFLPPLPDLLTCLGVASTRPTTQLSCSPYLRISFSSVILDLVFPGLNVIVCSDLLPRGVTLSSPIAFWEEKFMRVKHFRNFYDWKSLPSFHSRVLIWLGIEVSFENQFFTQNFEFIPPLLLHTILNFEPLWVFFFFPFLEMHTSFLSFQSFET